jgi:LuxR family maltose regulon positive regulatory protein
MSLLTTKLYIPPPRPNLVERPRLIERLGEGLRLGHKLTLVSAPAGSGKTTLVSARAASQRHPVAWVSLDKGDNDLVRFWSYLVAALQTVPDFDAGSVGEDALKLFKAPQPVPIEAILTTLINDITILARDSQEEWPLVLVLDDLHLIEAPSIFEALTFLLDHLPPQIHLATITRVDPPLPLARLRARGQITELRTADLRFTPDEAADFLKRTTGLTLPSTAVTALEERTEGWIAGLQMAAYSMRGQEDIAGFIEAFTGKSQKAASLTVGTNGKAGGLGVATPVRAELARASSLRKPRRKAPGSFTASNRYVIEYLLEEVLGREPEDVRTFLLQTSPLDRLTGALCDHLTGEANGQDVLRRLEDANLFIVPLDHDRHWYRYHHLFADSLRKQLEASQPEALPRLHRQASAWYAQNGLLAEAVNHALKAQDIERAAHLIEQAAFEALDRGEVSSLVGWLAALPDETIRARPWLCVLHAWMLIISGQQKAIEARLQDAEEALGTLDSLEKQEVTRIEGYISAIRAQVAFIRSAIPDTIEFAQDALEKIPARDYSVRATTTMILGAAYGFIDDLAAASRAFSEARTIGQTNQDNFSVMLASSALAQLEVVHGQLRKAERTYREALQLIERPSGVRRGHSPGVGYTYVGLAEVLREKNELEAATRYAEEGLDLCKLLGQAEILMSGYVALARIQRARENIEGALVTLQEAIQIATEMSAWSVDVVTVHQARLWLAQGNLEAASRWAQASGLSADDAPSFHREAGHLTLARILVAQGRPDDADRLLMRLLEAADSTQRWGSTIEALALLALTQNKKKEPDRALHALERALSLAEPEGYVRIFVDEGAPMAGLLRQAAERGIAPRYVHELLTAFGAPESAEPRHAQPLIEPLSDREVEVLHLAAVGLSNREIAEQLYISINTVKAHTKSVYRKLDAHNRTQAINRAQELGLL